MSLSIGVMRRTAGGAAVRWQQLRALSAASASASSTSATGKKALPQIKATLRSREEEGSRRSRELRKANQIPGIIYGKDPAKVGVPGAPQLRKSVSVDQRDVLREFRRLGASIENTLFEMVLDDGSKYEVTPRQLQVHPISEMPLAMNYVVYRPGSILRVPFKYINEEDCVDMKRGSFLVHVNRFVEVVCEPGAEVPQYVLVDLATADRFTAFSPEKFILPPGAKLHHSVPKSFVSAVLKSASGN